MPVRGADSLIVLAGARAREANRGFLRLVIGSLTLHGALFGAILYVGSLKPRMPNDLAALPVELVTLGKPRDPNLLPRKVKPPPPPPVEAPEAPPVQAEPEASPDAVALDSPEKPEKPKKKPAPKQTPKRISDAARKLLAGAEDRRLDEALERIETPEGSPDGSLLGTTTDPSAAANTYEAQVKGILQNRYKLPMTVSPSQRQFLEAEVVLFIDAQGRIRSYEFLKRHANEAFMGALEGLLRDVKLPAPPRELRRDYANRGLAIRFKP